MKAVKRTHKGLSENRGTSAGAAARRGGARLKTAAAQPTAAVGRSRIGVAKQRSRRRVGAAGESVQVPIARALLARADACAELRGLEREHLVCEALLAAVGKLKDPKAAARGRLVHAAGAWTWRVRSDPLVTPEERSNLFLCFVWNHVCAVGRDDPQEREHLRVGLARIVEGLHTLGGQRVEPGER